MKKILVASALAIATLSVSPIVSAPAIAQAKGVGVADVRVAAARSNAGVRSMVGGAINSKR